MVQRESRARSITRLRIAIAKQKELGWPAAGWRLKVAELAAAGTGRSASGMQSLISTLTYSEWEGLGLPDAARMERPKAALHPEALVQRYLPILSAKADALFGEHGYVTAYALASAARREIGRPLDEIRKFIERHLCDEPTLARLHIKDEHGELTSLSKPERRNAPLRKRPDTFAKNEGEEGDEEIVSTALIRRRVDKRYVDAFAQLPPGMRTIEGLAEAMKLRRSVVASYLFQHKKFAALLSDGGAALQPVRARARR